MISNFFIKFTVKWTKKEKSISSINKANRTSVHKKMQDKICCVKFIAVEGQIGL